MSPRAIINNNQRVMRKLFIMCMVLCFPFALWADEMDLGRLLFDCTKPGDNTSYLKNIDGDILITYPKGNCTIHNNSTLAIVSLFGRQTLYDYRGEICSYETIQIPGREFEGFYIVSNTKKYGIIDVSGKNIVPIIYDNIDIFYDNNDIPKAVVRKDGKTGLLEIELNSLIIPLNYDSIGGLYGYLTTASGHFLVQKNGKFGLINANLHNITSFKYDYIGIGPEEEYCTYINDKWHSLNLARIKLNDKWGILNTVSGQEVLPCMYDKISWQYTSDLFICKKGDKWGCVNHQNNVIIPFQFLDNEKYLYVNNGYRESILDADIIGKNENGEVSIFNSKGKLQMSGIEDIHCLRDYENKRIYIIKKNNKWVMVDSKFFKVIYAFDNVSSWEMWSSSGRYLISENTDGSQSLWDIDTKKKLIDSGYGIKVINSKYATGYYYFRGPSFIMNLITGKTTKLPDGYSVVRYRNELFVVQQKKGNEYKLGVIDFMGNIIIPLEYATHLYGDYYSSVPTIDDDDITEELILVKEAGIFSHSGKLLLRGNFFGMESFERVHYDDPPASGPLYKLLQDEGQPLRIAEYNKYEKRCFYGYYIYDGGKLNELLPCKYDKGDEACWQICSGIHQMMRPDTDVNIPVNKMSQNDLFAVIIANENYSEDNVENVQFAKKDGEIFREYCQRTLGIPSQNIRYRENATLNNIRSEVNWICDMAKIHNGGARIIFYYSGHGIPDEKNATSYLLPTDGLGSDPRTAYSVSELYTQLGNIPSKMTIVFMDACFSGAKRDGEMMVSSRGVAIKVKPTSPKGNMVVFSAAQEDQAAYAYRKKKHGMFTYFLLKKLQGTKGEATLEELATYIKEQVQKYSITENGKLQTPTIQFSPELQTSIKQITLY